MRIITAPTVDRYRCPLGIGFQSLPTVENATGILRAPRLRCTMEDMHDPDANRQAFRSRCHAPATRVGLWLGLVWAAATALAQPTAGLRVDTSRPYANEAVRVEIRVEGHDECEAPTFPELANCTVQYAGRTSGTSISQVGGGAPRVSRQVTFTFVLTPEQAGPLVIPAIAVSVDGKTLKTEPVKLMVREVPESPQPRPGQRDDADKTTGTEGEKLLLAEITCDQSKLFVGQRARFTLSVWIKPAEYEGQALSQRDMRQFLTGRIGPFDLEGERNRKVYREMADGSQELYYLVEFTGEMTLDQPGPLSFDDVSLGMDYPTRFARARLWGDLRITDHRPLRVRPIIAAPEVQPLPAEGRPANFSDAVGRYQISTFAVPSNVRVGDPIKLVIDISGEPVESIPGPELSAHARLNEDFRVPTEALAGTVRGNQKRFTQTIRAKRADVKEIPAIEFAYFDPELGQYAVARSKPIPILVSVVEQLNAADLTDMTSPSPQPAGATLEARDGLRGNKTREADLLASAPSVTMTRVLLTTIIPPTAFVCVLGISALTRSGRNSATRRRRSALRNAEHRLHEALANRLSPGEFHSEIQAALAGYLADRLNQPPARFLGPAAIDFLERRAVDGELIGAWTQVQERCERAAYAGNRDSDTSLADTARECLRRLERERL
jgi:hypothetical protein